MKLEMYMINFFIFSFIISLLSFLSVYHVYWKSYIKMLKKNKLIKNKLTKNKVRYLHALGFAFIFSFLFNFIFFLIFWFILK